MPDPEKDAQVDPSATGDQNKTGEGDKPAGDDKSKTGDQTKDQFVTPTALQGVIDAHKRVTTAEIKKLAEQNGELKGAIEQLTEALAKKDAPDGDKDKKESENAELIEMRRRVDELTKQAEANASRAEAEKSARLDGEFKTDVINALVAAGCEKPDEAFLVIKPRLRHDPEKGAISATVATEYGETDLDLPTYIERHFKEEVLPHVFKGKIRTGGPASGDDGAPGKHEMSKEQAFDINEYSKDPEKYRAAFERDRVAGVKKPVS